MQGLYAILVAGQDELRAQQLLLLLLALAQGCWNC
jgi:hypothetical protein